MATLDILEAQERQRLASMSLKQACDAVERGIYTVEEIMEANPTIQTIMRELILADARN
jgi:hypothetical protein